MKSIILSLVLVFNFSTASFADDETTDNSQNLNDNLSTASGYDSQVAMTAAPANYRLGQGVAQCRANESASSGTQADISTAYYDCLKRVVSE